MISGMHSTLSRFNSITSFATTVLFVLLALVALVAYPFGYAPAPSAVGVQSFRMFRGRPGTGYASRPIQDVGVVEFDLDADLSPLFNWNTKQVFLSLSAVYDAAPKEERQLVRAARSAARSGRKALPPGHDIRRSNEVVLWDAIVPSRDRGHVVLPRTRSKYLLREVDRSFRYAQSSSLPWVANPSPSHTTSFFFSSLPPLSLFLLLSLNPTL